MFFVGNLSLYISVGITRKVEYDQEKRFER